MKTFKVIVENAELEELKTIVSARLTARSMFQNENAEFTLTVGLNPDMKKDSFRIAGKPNAIRIVADTLINAYAGCGRFLHLSKYSNGAIIPASHRGLTTFDCEIRAVYMATHFHTFHYNAPLDRVFTYLEDMALMGINIIQYDVPAINLDTGKIKEMEEAFDRCAVVCKKAKSLGMKLRFSATTSCTFFEIPEKVRAIPIPDTDHCRGNTGKKVCPSKPDGQKILDEQNRFLMKEWKKRGVSVDYVGFFPYDEGGCGCSECHPWGGRGYIKACKRAKAVIKEFYPDCKFAVSTWLFDRPVEGEWEALCASLEKEKWADVIEADSHSGYPRYPLDVKAPGNLPLTAFPEISMWGLWPWGGYGASFFPKRYTEIWQSTEGKLCGGRMYSEGIYEDLNKYTVAGLYRDFNNNPSASVSEYAGYYFGCTETADFVEMVDCIEKNTVLNAEAPGLKVFMTEEKNKSDLRLAKRAWELAQKIDAELPEWGRKSWRWRLMYIRAFVDLHRYNNERLHENPDVVKVMEELMDIYCCIKDYKIDVDPFHLKLRPPLPVYDETFDISKYSNIGSILTAADIGLIVSTKPIEIKSDFAGDKAGNQA